MVPHWLETKGFDGKKVRFYPDSGEPIGWESESGYLRALEEFIISPNPFNPATLISYELPEGNRARVEVFDLLGRSIAVLVDEIQQAGYHQVRFVSDNLPSGVYFYQLTSGDFSAACKMLLIH